MTIAIRPNPQKAPELDEPHFVFIQVSDEYITAKLSDGRLVSVPLAWSWRLEQASSVQRNDYRFLGGAIQFGGRIGRSWICAQIGVRPGLKAAGLQQQRPIKRGFCERESLVYQAKPL